VKVCGKLVPKAKNGVYRGVCGRLPTHNGRHANGTCTQCAVSLTFKNAAKNVVNLGQGMCRICRRYNIRNRLGQNPKNYQRSGRKHTFINCGCAGVLPRYGGNNKFAAKSGPVFICRVTRIIIGSQSRGKLYEYAPIPRSTPHSVIREFMEEPNCERCGEPLKWEFEVGKTPHLHHSHETGEIYGFTHPTCNPQALENEIDRLKKLIRRQK
jgi:hypothetical protein